MFASVRRYRLVEGAMEELAQRVDHTFADRLRGQAGFVSYEFVDCGDGEVITVSMFATEDMAEVSRELAEEWTEAALDDMTFERLEMLHGEVSVSRARETMLRAAHAEGDRVARIRRYHVDPGAVRDIMHLVDDRFAPELEGLRDIEAYHALDCGDGEIISITICHDAAAAEESDALARRFVTDDLAGFEIRRTEALTGAVLVSRAIERLLEPAHA